MPKKGIQKSIQVYLSKIRKPAVPDHHDPVDHRDIPHAGSAAAGWLLSACKHPRTPSFVGDDREDCRRKEGGRPPAPHDEAAATLKDIDKFLFENFRSLYVNKDDPRRRKDGDRGEDDDEDAAAAVLLCESPTFAKTPPSLRASHRFFVSTSLDNSLLERPCSESSAAGDPRSSSSSSSSSGVPLPGDSLAVLTYSRRPYDDFRRSMQEMVEARREMVGPSPAQHGQALDWDFMEELLFCYLRLNEKRAHKYILGAFVDLVVSFRPAKAPSAAASRPRRNKKPSPGERISRRRRRHRHKADSSSDERDS
ncbi:hypothetical protein H6P81_003794 [Aristolochia fimbriata]|uniref:Transcription repressor n=1 Tax=Aristolochia fimbriata TaxID=158543 RepID=A0AAV7FH32_ARIFI|nr:hypothetical protein H6P81_003794 [Aristolochia fimbriata]